MNLKLQEAVARIDAPEEAVRPTTFLKKRDPHIKKLWFDLLLVYRLGSRAKRMAVGIIHSHLAKINHQIASQEKSFLDALQNDVGFSVKEVEKLLGIPIKKRPGDVLKALDLLLKPRFNEYAKIPEDERYHMCQLMRLAQFPGV